MKFLKLILITCIITSLFSCSGPLTESNNNQTVEYQLGSPFQIQLEGDAEGKNKWLLDSKIEPIITLIDQNTIFKDGKKLYNFNFKVNTDGEKEVVLIYQNDGIKLKVFQVKVIAGTMGRILGE
jgi:hypothetical protein